MAITLVIVHGAVCGAPWCCNGRSNFKTHHSHACKTTSPSRSNAVAPCVPPHLPAGRVVVVAPLWNGVEALNDISAHRAQTDPKPCRISHRQCHILLQVEEVVQLAGGLATMQAVRPRDLRGP